jgi:hypothetical protein
MVMKWKDKKDVTMISTSHDTTLRCRDKEACLHPRVQQNNVWHGPQGPEAAALSAREKERVQVVHKIVYY